MRAPDGWTTAAGLTKYPKSKKTCRKRGLFLLGKILRATKLAKTFKSRESRESLAKKSTPHSRGAVKVVSGG
jgi:hypothetical protein